MRAGRAQRRSHPPAETPSLRPVLAWCVGVTMRPPHAVPTLDSEELRQGPGLSLSMPHSLGMCRGGRRWRPRHI
jgi:hypothetical protein